MRHAKSQSGRHVCKYEDTSFAPNTSRYGSTIFLEATFAIRLCTGVDMNQRKARQDTSLKKIILRCFARRELFLEKVEP